MGAVRAAGLIWQRTKMGVDIVESALSSGEEVNRVVWKHWDVGKGYAAPSRTLLFTQRLCPLEQHGYQKQIERGSLCVSLLGWFIHSDMMSICL